MNLEESNEFIKEEKSKNKKKKFIMFLIIICIIGVILLFGFISVLKYMDENTKKIFINGERKNLSNTLIIEQDGKKYISVEEFAKLLGYKYANVEYKTLNQDSDYCYIDNGYEAVSIKVDSDKVKKYLKNETSDTDITQNNTQNNQQPAENQLPKFIVKSKDNTMELYELESKTIKVNDSIYLPFENTQKIFNVNLNVVGNITYVYNLNYLYQQAVANFVTSGAYAELSNYYENVRALVDGMVILKDKDNKYGVITFDGKMTNILAFVYTDIQYMQNTEDFFIYTKNTVGVSSRDPQKNEGKTIISPMSYDELTVFDQINKLYLAKSKNKYGVLNIDGDDVVPVTYEKVGYSSLNNAEEFENTDSDSPELLDDEFIVVYEDDCYGLYNLDGDLIIRPVYDGFGFVRSQTDNKKNIENVLTIPKEAGIHGLVIEQEGLYGLFDLDNEELVLPCSFSKIYKTTKGGEIKYYLEFRDEQYEIKDVIGEPEEEEQEEQEEQDEQDEENDNEKNNDRENDEEKDKTENDEDSEQYDENDYDDSEYEEENYDDQNQEDENRYSEDRN